MHRTFTKAESLVHTSADDCKTSLNHYRPADLPALEQALEMATRLGYKTKAVHIARAIRRIKKEATTP